MRVRLTKQAQRDIDGAAEWYEAKREGLGDEFLDRVQEGIDRIGLNPLGFQKVRGENRRANLEQFPFALFFKVVDEVIVVGCLHGRRNPAISREREAGIIELPKPPEPS